MARRQVLPEFFKAIGAARFGVMAGVAAALTAFFLYVAGAITEPREVHPVLRAWSRATPPRSPPSSTP